MEFQSLKFGSWQKMAWSAKTHTHNEEPMGGPPPSPYLMGARHRLDPGCTKGRGWEVIRKGVEPKAQPQGDAE